MEILGALGASVSPQCIPKLAPLRITSLRSQAIIHWSSGAQSWLLSSLVDVRHRDVRTWENRPPTVEKAFTASHVK